MARHSQPSRTELPYSTTQSNTERTTRMTKLDQTFSSLIEIDSHALHTVTGGMHLIGEGGSTSAAKPKKTGKGKQILAGGLLLGGALIGPEHPGPDDINLGGPIVGKPL